MNLIATIAEMMRGARRDKSPDEYLEFLRELNALLADEVKDMENRDRMELAMRSPALN